MPAIVRGFLINFGNAFDWLSEAVKKKTNGFTADTTAYVALHLVCIKSDLVFDFHSKNNK